MTSKKLETALVTAGRAKNLPKAQLIPLFNERRLWYLIR